MGEYNKTRRRRRRRGENEGFAAPQALPGARTCKPPHSVLFCSVLGGGGRWRAAAGILGILGVLGNLDIWLSVGNLGECLHFLDIHLGGPTPPRCICTKMIHVSPQHHSTTQPQPDGDQKCNPAPKAPEQNEKRRRRCRAIEKLAP
eukprot:gene14870-biopygen5151